MLMKNIYWNWDNDGPQQPAAFRYELNNVKEKTSRFHVLHQKTTLINNFHLKVIKLQAFEGLTYVCRPDQVAPCGPNGYISKPELVRKTITDTTNSQRFMHSIQLL